MRKWRKRVFKAVGFLSLIPLLLFAFLLFEHFRGKIGLARYKRALIAMGEKLSPSDFASSTTNGENGAPELFAAISDLKEGTVLPKRFPPRMKATPSGRAIVCFREEEWVEAKVTNDWNQVFDDLATNKTTLDRIRTALEKPVLDNKMDLSRGYKMDYTHLSRAKYPTHWFGAACQLELHEGRTHKALEYLRSEIGLPRVLAEDKIAISELVRFAMAAIARGDTWEAIQASDWRDEDLAKIQEAWASPQFIGGLVGGLQGEVVYEISSGELLRQSNEDTARSLFLSMDEIFHGDEAEKPLWERLLSNLPGGDAAADFLKKQVYCRIWRFAWLDQHERHTLEGLEKLLNIARSAAKEKSFAAADSAIVEVLANREDRSIYDKLRYPMSESAVTLSRTVARAMRAETERSLLICAVALERYSLRHGDPPASLDALVPEFLVSLPIDYMDGKPLRYRLNADKTFTLYSVGEDGKDDGGDATLMPGKTSPQNLWNRKDFVWPAPALPEEVEAYRKEATKY